MAGEQERLAILPPGVVERRVGFDVTNRSVLHDRFNMQLIGDQVVAPDGNLGERYWFKFSTRPVMTFPMNGENIFLLKGPMYGVNGIRIEAADGPMREGETPEQAAGRITKDEIGVEIDRPHRLHEGLEEITGRAENSTIIYLARAAQVLPQHPALGGSYQRLEVPFPEAMDMVRRQEIVNAVVTSSLWFINDLFSSQGVRSFEDLKLPRG